jgi:hypothetical protein
VARPNIKTSQRFSRAARAERDRLSRSRAQLERKRSDLRQRLEAVELEIGAVDEQMRVLEDIAQPPPSEIQIRKVAPADGRPEQLGGARIREVAVPILLRLHGEAPIHYRDWYSLFRSEGYEAAGKRPDAVFLNQVSRSPLVRSSTKSGFYLVDPTVVDDLRQTLVRRQGELAELLTDTPVDASALEARRLRQRELTSEIAKIERDLAEAVSAVERADRELPGVRAA